MDIKDIIAFCLGDYLILILEMACADVAQSAGARFSTFGILENCGFSRINQPHS